MARRFSRAAFTFIFVLAAFVTAVPAASADDASTVIARDGIAVDSLALPKGRLLHVAALVGGKLANEPATWSSVPEGVVDVRDLGGGRAEVKALRDIFDAGGKEPRASLRVCVGESCAMVGVVCLVDVAGRWYARASIPGVPGTLKDDFALRQDGRRILYKDVVIRLEGTSMRLVSGGDTLSRFNGSLSSGTSASGSWISTRGFGGTWTATK